MSLNESPQASTIEDIVSEFLWLTNQIKQFHWYHDDAKKHEILGNLYDSFSEKVDEFVEVYMGMYPDEKSPTRSFPPARPYEQDPAGVPDFFKRMAGYIKRLESDERVKDTDLMNVVQDMGNQLGRTRYLYAMK